MTNNISYPPVEFIFFDYEQPDEDAWNAINEFEVAWNRSHENKLLKGEMGEWSVVLKNGIQDDEFPVMKKSIEQLIEKYKINYFLGAVDNRKPKEFEKAPFVAIVGNTYPLEFVVNFKEAIGEAKPCANCGSKNSYNAPILKSLVIDESFLDKQIDESSDYTPPGLDLINLENGALLVSKKIVQLLQSSNIMGYELIPVISNASEKPSERIFLLRAAKAILTPCDIHTPTTEEGICPACGKILGGILGNYYVRGEWLGEDKIFSRHPLKYASIYLSNDLYHAMKKINAKGLLPAFGIYECNHFREQVAEPDK